MGVLWVLFFWEFPALDPTHRHEWEHTFNKIYSGHARTSSLHYSSYVNSGKTHGHRSLSYHKMLLIPYVHHMEYQHSYHFKKIISHDFIFVNMCKNAYMILNIHV